MHQIILQSLLFIPVKKDGYVDIDEILCLRPLQESSAFYSLISLVTYRVFTVICSIFLTGIHIGNLVKIGSPARALYVLMLENFRYKE